MNRNLRLFVTLAVAATAAGAATAVASASSGKSSLTTGGIQTTTIATGLHQPKGLSIAPNGDVVVVLSGDGKAPASCRYGSEPSCVDHSAGVDEVLGSDKVRTLVSGLVSVAAKHTSPQATGPSLARLLPNGDVKVLFQGQDISTTTGLPTYGRVGAEMNTLSTFSRSGKLLKVDAQLGVYQAQHKVGVTTGSGGSEVSLYHQSIVDSDPFDFVPYRGGYAIADAAANDVLWLSPKDQLSVLAALPPIREYAAPGTFGQKKGFEAEAQAVPTSVAVSPSGALYVGELGGAPADPGTETVYRVANGRAIPYASHFTAIIGLAFDRKGRLLVLEFDQKGYDDPGQFDGRPVSGAVIRVAGRRKTTLIGSGLPYATGLAVGRSGAIYVTVNGVNPTGYIVRVTGF